MSFGNILKQMLNLIERCSFFKELPADIQCSLQGILKNQNLQLKKLTQEQILQSSSIF